jgi:hypothetical protein
MLKWPLGAMECSSIVGVGWKRTPDGITVSVGVPSTSAIVTADPHQDQAVFQVTIHMHYIVTLLYVSVF